MTNIPKRGIIFSTGGEDVEDSVGGRIASLRKNLGMTQEEFANSICMSRSNLSNIEKDRFTITDRVIDTICAKFGVNEKWLRTGEGEMFPKPDTDPLWGMLGEVLKEEKSSFRRQLITALCQHEPDELAAIEKVIDKFLAEREKTKKEEG